MASVVGTFTVDPRSRAAKRRARGEGATGWAFVSPSVVIILGLSVVPVLWSLLLSFQVNDLVSPSEWVGLANYKALVKDPAFGSAVSHTLIYTALYVPLSVVAGLGIAIALDRKIALIGLYRTLVFVPFVVSAAAQGVLFSFVLDPEFGVANSLLHKLGLPAQGFFSDPGQALYLLVAISLWSGTGFCVIVYLAGLQGVSAELVEAARIDGAGRLGGAAARDAARAGTGHDLPAAVPDHQRVAGVRHHEGRTARVDDGDRVLHLGEGLQDVHGRLQRGSGVHAGRRVAGGRRRLADLSAEGGCPMKRLPFSGWHLVLAPLALLFALPLVWLLVSSVMSNAEINRFPPALWPHGIKLDGYRYVLGNALFPRWFLNSFIVSAVAVTANLVLGSLGGYAFARIRFAGSKLVLGLMLATMVIPFQLTMIPTFLVMKQLGLIDTLGALIVPSLVTPLSVFLFRQFFVSLPRELEEAAWIDGCGRLRILVSIVLPLARPALSTVAVLTFLATWNDLTWPLIAINTDTTYTLQLGLTTFQGQHHTQWSAVMAGNVITVLPVLLGFLLAQKAFIRSLASTGLKG
ncbi:ABC-type glycerol-3-phosphate transport system permease component [Kribbella sp. VKM Ac-2571]|uniref:ABC transporter permease n=1 Tax=Kribbella sp. VKM Ac-2571 TaxID=2512222 RepID=UPI0010D1DABA|nr:ABC transporter permease subunit [Kribbella sp. VKM Ac-2571]TDO47655.1 ABC-type glycerol-3-phosphate transport system permease component [Kribbella sp. VKM Ac-2571]